MATVLSAVLDLFVTAVILGVVGLLFGAKGIKYLIIFCVTCYLLFEVL
nr:MAG TPA: hypothetical protein [Bacteriophage sp.]